MVPTLSSLRVFSASSRTGLKPPFLNDGKKELLLERCSLVQINKNCLIWHITTLATLTQRYKAPHLSEAPRTWSALSTLRLKNTGNPINKPMKMNMGKTNGRKGRKSHFSSLTDHLLISKILVYQFRKASKRGMKTKPMQILSRWFLKVHSVREIGTNMSNVWKVTTSTA